MIREFTGRHMLAVMVAFFGVVIAVNIFMARMAVGTFGGTVVENSYVASQKFNGWLAEADRQAGLGWKTAHSLDASRHLRVVAEQGGAPLDRAIAKGSAYHPLGRAEPMPIRFERAADGTLRSTAPLPAGRWEVRLLIESDGKSYRMHEILQ